MICYPTVKLIIREHLKAKGLDGLVNLDGMSCGCTVADLMPCEGSVATCVPGHKVDCDAETCEIEGECGWHIAPGQRPDEKEGG